MFRLFLLSLLLLPVAFLWGQDTFCVVLDPGHGGRDPGQLASDPTKYRHEKDIALSIAKKAAQYISERIPNTTVHLTRYADSTVSLPKRTERANALQANVFVSIHCNSNPITEIMGARVHIQSTDFGKSHQLANILRDQLRDRAKRHDMGLHTFNDRGINLYVLKHTDMPSVLVEVGFLSHPDEERYLNSDYGQDIIASAIFRAVRSFKEQHHK